MGKLWKGILDTFAGKPVCGAQMKIGMQTHSAIRCQLLPGHLGCHRANALTAWSRTAEEHEEHIRTLNNKVRGQE